MKKLLSIAMLGLILTTLSAYAQIPVLSVDDQGNEAVTMISEDDYQNIMSVEADSLAGVAEDQVALAATAPHLTLKGILVGVEASASVGNSAYKLGTAVNQQFYFEIKK